MKHEMKHVVLGVIVALGMLSRPTEQRRRLRQGGLPRGMHRAKWGGGRPQDTYREPRQTCSLLRQRSYRAGCVGANGAAVVRKPY